jgi:hypothetical protein
MPPRVMNSVCDEITATSIGVDQQLKKLVIVKVVE